MTRTFIALELNEALQRCLGGLIRQAAAELPGLNWLKPAGIHLTLAFLGELSDDKLKQASYAAERAAQISVPFEFRLSHLGIFGSPRQPRVLWVGIEEPSGRLQQLQRVINWELQQRGLTVETRPFSPHLTLARCKVSLQAEEQECLRHILRARRFSPSPALFAARQISVMKSELSQTGATYTSLRDYPFLGS